MTDEFARLWKEIGTHGVMVLSTCDDSLVTSRSMSVVVTDGKFYCQTNRNYLKCRQIEKNPNVSLCFGHFSIEGKCRILGRPYDVPLFMEALDSAYPDAVRRWSALPEECVLEISPGAIRAWIYENDIPYIESWDIFNKTYKKEKQ
ncbi:pyridoxamine 5'-phosphate oxidase family protein [Ruminococcus sp.]|uniref:pyridoxamine 5'-phosphate oxidase family protein n=1 Tax=Ruminococcus sp. TaxID=41978 RepID=UPI0025DE6BF0|nr:pyridoxamine 5'-phosphate oxidase family protein [Ruminococcus sp.]MBQ8968028.1 pyridoxamine 5'-phosphate oxidase family protein [Ruminococcus sp.]